MSEKRIHWAVTLLAWVAIVALWDPCHYQAKPAGHEEPTADDTGSGGLDGSSG